MASAWAPNTAGWNLPASDATSSPPSTSSGSGRLSFSLLAITSPLLDLSFRNLTFCCNHFCQAEHNWAAVLPGQLCLLGGIQSFELRLILEHGQGGAEISGTHRVGEHLISLEQVAVQ
jgi:hypothetical protein